jgi:hypothetical protein
VLAAAGDPVGDFFSMSFISVEQASVQVRG